MHTSRELVEGTQTRATHAYLVSLVDAMCITINCARV